MIYTFTKVEEMDTLTKVYEVVAKDLHSALRAFYEKHSENDYDLLSINGEWI